MIFHRNGIFHPVYRTKDCQNDPVLWHKPGTESVPAERYNFENGISEHIKVRQTRGRHKKPNEWFAEIYIYIKNRSFLILVCRKLHKLIYKLTLEPDKFGINPP
jgi:hypothetical protein